VKKTISKSETKKKIELFFQRDNFEAEEVKKIKKLAMKLNIKLGKYRNLFCRKCLSMLRGSLRVNKTHKIIACSSCGEVNKHKI